MSLKLFNVNINFRHWPIILMILVFPLHGNAQLPGEKYSTFLKQTVKGHDRFWVRVHAAEALVSNNYKINAEQIFKTELQKDGAEKIGALRVMARINRGDSIKIDSITKEIIYQFHNAQNEHEKLVALESLGKLGLSPPDKQIFELARSGKGGIKVLAQWVLANSGNPLELNELADLLYSDDSIQFRYAAYSLRFIENISPLVYIKMKDKFKNLEESHPFRAYLISALYVHAPDEELNLIKEKLLTYLNGENYEKYEVYEALAVKGSKKDISLLKERFQEENDDDIKVAAANAFLANEY